MKIGYISPIDPFRDRKAWSGTYFSTREALENAGNTVEWISYNSSSIWIKLSYKLYRFIFGKVGNVTHFRLVGWLKAKSIRKNLDEYDILFIPGQSELVGYLKTVTPIIYYSDTTVPLMINYYWFDFSNKAIKE